MPLDFGLPIICKASIKNRKTYIVAAENPLTNRPVLFIITRMTLVKAIGKNRVTRYDDMEDFANCELPLPCYRTLSDACRKAFHRSEPKKAKTMQYFELIEKDFWP
jgi:hypothetical protein